MRLLPLLLLVACDPTIPEGLVDTGDDPCDPLPADVPYAVELHATSASGNPLTEAVATWSAGDSEPRVCDTLTTTSWMCGVEISGPITVQVEAPGHETRAITPVVELDECDRPITRRIDLELEGTPCPPGEVPAVIAEVVGPILDGFVGWKDAATDGPFQQCDLVGDATWACGWNFIGGAEVALHIEGVPVETAMIEVRPDDTGCFPETEFILLESPFRE